MAWVAGSARHGYEIAVTEVEDTKEFWFLNRKRFKKIQGGKGFV
jgi:hypothetical protein